MKNPEFDILVPRTEFINLQTDFGFKRIFGSEERKSILIRFLNALFEGESVIEDVIFKDKEQLLPVEDRKRIVYDVYCVSTVDGRNNHFILEMQNCYDRMIADRTMYYVSTAVALQGERNVGWIYSLENVFSITFMSDSLANMSPRLVRRVMLMDVDTHEIFSSRLRMLFISLNRMDKDWDECGNELEKYIYLIKNMDKMDRNSKAYLSGEFDELFKASERMVMEPAEAVAYSDSYLRMRNFRHNLELVREESLEKGFERGMEIGREEGRKEGQEEGRKEGREEGQRDERISITGRMLRHGADIGMICSVTGLSKEEVESLG